MTTGSKSDPELREAVAALQRLADAFARRRGQLAQGVGLSEAQWRVLEEIAAEDFMPSLFARRREQTPAAVSKLIRQLLDRKLVVASIASGDARQRRYALTAKGSRAIEQVRLARQRALDQVWADLEPERLAEFARFASDLAERMEAHERSESTAAQEEKGRGAARGHKKTRRSGSLVET